MNLTRLDLFALARVLAGFNTTGLRPTQPLSPGIPELLNKLMPLNYKDRWSIAGSYLPRAVLDRIQTIDVERPPLPTVRLLGVPELHDLPPVAWLIPDELPDRALIVVMGESGAGKSFLTLDYACRLSAARPVVYVPTESVHGYSRRVDAWSALNPQANIDRLLFMPEGLNLYAPERIQELLAALTALKPCLVVIDTLAMAMTGGDENSARDMGLVLKLCRRLISELETSVLLVHHVGVSGQRERGSTALRGNADTMIRVSANDDLLSIECVKMKDAAPFPTRVMRLKPVELPDGETSMALVPATKDEVASQSLSDVQRKLMTAMLMETLADGVHLRELVELTSVSLSTVHRAMSTLIRKDMVRKDKSGYVLTALGRSAARPVSSVSSVFHPR